METMTKHDTSKGGRWNAVKSCVQLGAIHESLRLDVDDPV